MNESTKEIIFRLIRAMTIIVIVMSILLAIVLVSLPNKWTFEITMDNNTREAMQSINYTAMYQRDCQPCDTVVTDVIPSDQKEIIR